MITLGILSQSDPELFSRPNCVGGPNGNTHVILSNFYAMLILHVGWDETMRLKGGLHGKLSGEAKKSKESGLHIEVYRVRDRKSVRIYGAQGTEKGNTRVSGGFHAGYISSWAAEADWFTSLDLRLGSMRLL